MEYISRVVDSQLQEALLYAGGVVLEGVRGCGKTRTAREHASSWVPVDSDDPQIRGALEINPALVLQGTYPRLVDEWQLQPSLWNSARRIIDDSDRKGCFIFTGSATPVDDPSRHSGAHRFSTIRMRPMTFFERKISQGRISLAALFDQGENVEFDEALQVCSIEETFEALAHGGWPADIELSANQALSFIRDYLDYVITVDMNRLIVDAQRDPERMRLILRSLARNVAAELNYSTVATDVAHERSISRNTVSQYISVLERLFLVERQPAWTGKTRSKTAIRTSEKIHFADPAIACSLLGINADGLMRDLNTAGSIFESAVFQHLSVFAEPLGGRVYHYRDKQGREVAAIVVLPNGRWAVFEVKLGARAIPTAEKSLTKFISNVDTKAVGEPVFRAIITGNGGCMKLPSGMITCNLAALMP